MKSAISSRPSPGRNRPESRPARCFAEVGRAVSTEMQWGSTLYQYRWESSQFATIFCAQHPTPNVQHPTPKATRPGPLDVGRSMLVVGCFGCGLAALRENGALPFKRAFVPKVYQATNGLLGDSHVVDELRLMLGRKLGHSFQLHHQAAEHKKVWNVPLLQ